MKAQAFGMDLKSKGRISVGGRQGRKEDFKDRKENEQTQKGLLEVF